MRPTPHLRSTPHTSHWIRASASLLLITSAWLATPAHAADADEAANRPPPTFPGSAPQGPRGATASLDTLFNKLKLQPAQMPLWQSYARRLGALQDLRYREEPVLATHTAPQQLHRLVLQQQNHLTALEDIETAARALYEQLTPEQRTQADALLLGSVPLPSQIGMGTDAPISSGCSKPSGPPGGGMGPHGGGGR